MYIETYKLLRCKSFYTYLNRTLFLVTGRSAISKQSIHTYIYNWKRKEEKENPLIEYLQNKLQVFYLYFQF